MHFFLRSKDYFSPIFYGGISLCIFLLLFVSMQLYISYVHVAGLEERVIFLQKKQQAKKIHQSQEEAILSRLGLSTASTIDPLQSLCSLTFLQPEQQKWKMLFAQTGLSPSYSETLLEKEGENRLEFSLKTEQTTPLFNEREWQQRFPVYLNEEDLKNILQKLDNTECPTQTVITSFSLEKKTFSEMQERVYALHMELLTRQKGY